MKKDCSSHEPTQSLFFNTLPSICVEKVAYMKTGEDLHCKVHQSPPRCNLDVRIPRNPEVRKSTDHQSEQSVKYLSLTSRGYTSQASQRKSAMEVQGNFVAVTLITENLTRQFRKKTNRNEIGKRLDQQFENHPNRDSLILDFEQD